jgi:hypothetical protein
MAVGFEENAGDEPLGSMPTPMSLTQYTVDIGTMNDFVAFVERELGLNYRPAVDGIRGDYTHGLNWGQGVHGELVRHGRAHYVNGQWQATQNLLGYLVTGLAMLDTIKRLTELYQTNEAMASLEWSQVEAQMSDALQRQAKALQATLHPTTYGHQEYS